MSFPDSPSTDRFNINPGPEGAVTMSRRESSRYKTTIRSDDEYLHKPSQYSVLTRIILILDYQQCQGQPMTQRPRKSGVTGNGGPG